MSEMPEEKKSKVIYVAGKMRGEDNLNYESFEEYTEKLRDMGYVVINPAAKIGGEKDMPREWFMEYSIQQVLIADAVALLPSWDDSAGAKLEAWIAQQLNKPVFLADDVSKGVYIQDVDFLPIQYPLSSSL